MFRILAARIVSLIGLGPSCLTRNSGLASTQTLTLGSVFAGVLYCWIAFWKWMIAWRKNEISTCIVFAFFSFQSCFIIKRIQGTVYWGGGRRHNTVLLRGQHSLSTTEIWLRHEEAAWHFTIYWVSKVKQGGEIFDSFTRVFITSHILIWTIGYGLLLWTMVRYYNWTSVKYTVNFMNYALS